MINSRQKICYTRKRQIINLINGKLRTPKINSFYDMIDFLNAKGDNIIKFPLDISPLNSNA